jgi:hypothetical protein
MIHQCGPRSGLRWALIFERSWHIPCAPRWACQRESQRRLWRAHARPQKDPHALPTRCAPRAYAIFPRYTGKNGGFFFANRRHHFFWVLPTQFFLGIPGKKRGFFPGIPGKMEGFSLLTVGTTFFGCCLRNFFSVYRGKNEVFSPIGCHFFA